MSCPFANNELAAAPAEQVTQPLPLDSVPAQSQNSIATTMEGAPKAVNETSFVVQIGIENEKSEQTDAEVMEGDISASGKSRTRSRSTSCEHADGEEETGKDADTAPASMSSMKRVHFEDSAETTRIATISTQLEVLGEVEVSENESTKKKTPESDSNGEEKGEDKACEEEKFFVQTKEVASDAAQSKEAAHKEEMPVTVEKECEYVAEVPEEEMIPTSVHDDSVKTPETAEANDDDDAEEAAAGADTATSKELDNGHVSSGSSEAGTPTPVERDLKKTKFVTETIGDNVAAEQGH